MRVESGACLEWLPQETIVFAAAQYRQSLRVDLAPDALWLGWDCVRFGRSARGERFMAGNWRSHTEVWRQGEPLWIDRQYLTGDPNLLDSPHGLAGQPLVATLAWIGRSVEPEIVEKIRALQARGNYAGELGVSRGISGLICRYRGSSSLEVRRWFCEIWQLLRLSYLERPICLPRVWQVGNRSEPCS
jgi:urease accessory protein